MPETTNVRLGPLRDDIAAEAKRERRPLSQMIRVLLTEALEARHRSRA